MLVLEVPFVAGFFDPSPQDACDQSGGDELLEMYRVQSCPMKCQHILTTLEIFTFLHISCYNHFFPKPPIGKSENHHLLFGGWNSQPHLDMARLSGNVLTEASMAAMAVKRGVFSARCDIRSWARRTLDPACCCCMASW